MSDVALKPRGIEDAETGVLLVAIRAGHGFVSLCTRRLPEPLGPAAWLHAVKMLVVAGLKVWPELSGALGKVIEDARAHAGAAEPVEQV